MNRKQFTLKASEQLDSAEGKRLFNLHHFTESAPRYDIATRFLSLGRDSAWKRKLLQTLPQEAVPYCVDIACGTGDVSIGLAEKYPKGQVLGTDLAQAMIDIAQERNSFENLNFAVGDMCNLEVESSTVDILTGSYAIRNAPDLEDALREIHRVLRPGGQAALLDFSKPTSAIPQRMQYLLLKFWGSLCGLILHGNSEIHGYISSSIKTFPDRTSLLALFEQNGLRVLNTQKLYFGMLEIILLEKSAR